VQERWRSVVEAGWNGDEPTARAALDDPDPVARTLALGALQRLGGLTDDDLRRAFGDLAAEVRRRAVLLAATRPGVELIDLLGDADATVVEAAAWSCGEQERVTDATLARLVDLAGSASVALVREACVAALGAIGDPRGLDAILAGCADVPAVRRRAVLALAPFDDPRVDAAIEAALTDRDWQVRQAAEDLRA
jgi:HEAT repeat protein